VTERKLAYMRDYNERNREKNRAYGRERYKQDPEKGRAKSRAYRKANPEKVAMAQAAYVARNRERLAVQKRLKPRDANRLRDSRIRRMYRLTPELFDRLAAKQGGACAICKVSLAESEPHIDHQHGGDVRGILCLTCNAGLGHFRDDVALMAAAIQYLADPPARSLLTPQLALFEAEVYAQIPESTRAKAIAAINHYLKAG
jgi:hypothetical protein